jgi:WD40 repeat protein
MCRENRRHLTAITLPRASVVLCTIAIAVLAASLEGAQGLPQTFNPPNPSYQERFGSSVAIDGNNVLIGAAGYGSAIGQVHLFDASNGDLLRTFNNPAAASYDEFGGSLAIDGNRVLIAEPGDDTNGDHSGQAHLFDAASGNLLHTFGATVAGEHDSFGGSVAIDGNNVLIGAAYDSSNGYEVGQAHLFNASNGQLVRTFNDPTVTQWDQFGCSVAIDGSNVVIGAIGDDTKGRDVGQVHLFDAASGNLLRTFNDPTVTSKDYFGYSVAISGNNVLIGAVMDDTNGADAGQAYLFNATTGDLLHIFDDPTPAERNRFGDSLAISGNNVLIGAMCDDTSGSNVGQAYLFDAITGDLLQTFDDPTATSSDYFGDSVAIDGEKVLIGATGNDIPFRTNSGQAHLFDVPEPATMSLLALGAIAVLRRRRKPCGQTPSGRPRRC